MKLARQGFILTILLFVSIGGLIAQGKPDNVRGSRERGGPPMGFIIQGQIIESSSQQSIDYATVTVHDKESEKVLEGATSENGGRFRLQSKTKDIYIEVSFIGYATKRITDITFKGKVADLGQVRLGEDTEVLDEVVITAERSSTEFKLDKRVFNVGTDLSSTGASALEVLNNVPSVNVNIEGGITLRGSSGVQVLINGKPSVLANDESNALGTITADMIESVEVITNPSAKYEAEGTSGIINIVLKSNEKRGINGSISLNTGIPDNHSVGLSLNKRTEKLNLFTQLGVGYKVRVSDVENINQDFKTRNTVSSIGEEARNETFYNIILGSDYYINPQNIITLSGSFAYEVEDQPSATEFNLKNDNGELLQNWSRVEVTEATNPKLQYELQYKRDFTDHKDHQLLFSAIGNYFGKDQSSIFTETLLSGTNNLMNQTTATEFAEGKYTFNLDYTRPLNEHWTIETGTQYVDNTVTNDFTVSDEINGIFVVDEGLTNLFEFDQKVLGLYGTGSYEGDLWGIKLGLRAERTDLSTLLANTNEENNRDFLDLFPSAHTSYTLSDRISFQAGYSRRIYRPRLWDLNPFFNIRNTFTIRTGNPDLMPEYTDSYEVGSIFIYDQISFNLNVYYRYTTDKIERVTDFLDNVSVFTPENIGDSKTTGLELNFKYVPVKGITINGDANYNYFNRTGQFNDQIFDFSNDQWSTKITSKFRASKSLDFEVTGRYQSEVQTVQGMVADNLYADLGLRYKLMNGKAVFILSVRDVFASRVRENVFESSDFNAFSTRQLGRFITLGFSYGFGKGEAMTYGGGGRRR